MQHLEEHIIKAKEGCIRSRNIILNKIFTLSNIYLRQYAKDNIHLKDIAQNLVIKLNNKFDKLPNEYVRFQKFIYRSTKNAYIDYTRVNKIQHLTYTYSYEYFLKNYIEEEEDNFYTEEVYKKVIELIEDLPKASKKVFKLYYLNGYSHSEIAEYLNINEGTSKSNLFKAKEKLRAWIIN